MLAPFEIFTHTYADENSSRGCNFPAELFEYVMYKALEVGCNM